MFDVSDGMKVKMKFIRLIPQMWYKEKRTMV